jgi:CubicO group peptidase (beta-lactamase class C family)
VLARGNAAVMVALLLWFPLLAACTPAESETSAVVAPDADSGAGDPAGALVAAGDPRAGVTGGTVEADLYFPPAAGEWETMDAAAVGWDTAALERALDYARSVKSSGVVVLHRGRIVAERYWPAELDLSLEVDRHYQGMVARTTEDGRTIEDIASGQKSVVSFLAGVAAGKGLLDFDAPVSRYLGEGSSKARPGD